jgi:SRSO17 transposase
MTTLTDIAGWADGLRQLASRLARHFARSEPRQRVFAYLRGLLAPIERKNGWQLAEAAGDPTPDGVQEFLSRVHWDADAVRDDMREYVVEYLGEPQAVLVLDETGFLKKGTKSVGVQRQYSGTAGRIENCQIGVFLAYVSRRGHAFIDRALYLPESWAEDRARRAEAGVPETVEFHTKPELGRAMLERAFAAGVPCAWVVGDCVYGCDHRLRRSIVQHGRGYVLEVSSAQRLASKRVQAWAAEFAPEAWQRLSAGDGAKGPRLYEWAYRAFPGGEPGWCQGLLVRRSLSKAEELAFYLTYAPETSRLSDLVRVAGLRWTIEVCFEEAKSEVGLDQYEVRRWDGWHRHITLALLAHAYLVVVRNQAAGEKKPGGSVAGAGSGECAGSSPSGVAGGVGPGPGCSGGAGVVAVASSAPAAGALLSLDHSNDPCFNPTVVLEHFPPNPDHTLRLQSNWRTPQARMHPAAPRAPATAPPCSAPPPCAAAPSASKTTARSD